MKYIIVGGVAGGATAAARIRRIDEQSKIIMLEKGKYISYANCGLPYYIGGTITSREKLFLQTPTSFGTRFNVDVRTENEVIQIFPAEKKILIRKADGAQYNESYDKLLLSPGATPVIPSIKGVKMEGIFLLRNVLDTDTLKDYLTTHTVKQAMVVGGGFIGLEMAENLHHTGAHVSLVEMENQVMPPIDFSMAAHVHEHLTQKGIALFLSETVTQFHRIEDKIEVWLKSGKKIMTDLVLISVGVRPEVAFLKDSGIQLGETGGIWVNDFLETSIKDIYAVGDAIEFPHPVTNKPWLNYLANPANRQGRLAADNMVKGNSEKYEGAIGTAIAKVFDLTVATTGLPGKKLKQLDIPYQSSVTHSQSHANYYPQSLPLTLKLTFAPQDGKLLGAQCVGYEGIDKRIDQIALLIKKGGTVYDLMKVEHAYAPPYSSAKDPIAIGGYVAGNILNGSMPVISWREMQQVNREESYLLDVRTADEYKLEAIAGSVNIPLDELRNRLAEIPTDRQIYVYCGIGLRGYMALKILVQRGFTKVKNLSGGYKTYSLAIAPVANQQKMMDPHEEKHHDGEQKKSLNLKIVKVDACGLQCPGPILKLKKSMEEIQEGDCIEISSTDPGFARDAQAWCNSTGNNLLSNTFDKGVFTILIEKGALKGCNLTTSCDSKGKTFIMFSDDLDKALATFVLANGAAATGQKTTIFFTFWGLNVIKKTEKPSVEKDIFGKMFSWMLPSHSLKLKLSKMNMLGIGSKMMRYIMKKKNIESLESLRKQAIEQGVELIACQMSMEVMGVKREELLEEVTVGGVATYMERADNANVNLFI